MHRLPAGMVTKKKNQSGQGTRAYSAAGGLQVAVGGQCIVGVVCTIHTTCPDQRRTVAGNSGAGGQGYGLGVELVHGNWEQSGRISEVHLAPFSLMSQVCGLVLGGRAEGAAVGTTTTLGGAEGEAESAEVAAGSGVAGGASSGGLWDIGASAPP